ncbi:MAG: aromatic acid decarboxylase, partial [Roseibium sp.]|uniref:flavoprotein n=1 Tax=Roseibium sp. TaxID=1936156 RepID=UPI00262B5781
MSRGKRVIVGISGASGAQLALETLNLLAELDIESHVTVTAGAEQTIRHELGQSGRESIRSMATCDLP